MFGELLTKCTNFIFQDDEKIGSSSSKEPSAHASEQYVVEEMEELSPLLKTSRKKYKMPKKKSPANKSNSRNKPVKTVEEVVVISDADDVERTLKDNPSGFVESRSGCELAKGKNKMEREREDTEEGMTDVLSSYTRLLSKPKLMNDAKLIDISERNDNGELGQYGFEKPVKEVVDIELTEEEFCPANSELKREDDDTENVNCSDVEEQATPTNVSVSSNDEDFDDFKLDGPWCCGLCTFNNNGLLRVCEICEIPRHKSRRKLTKTALSTPEFVKRKQQKILERCLSSEKKTKSRNQGLKKDNFPFVMQGDTEERLGFVGTTRDDGISEYQAETIEDETSRELQEFENSSFDATASSFKTRVEPQGQSTSLVEDELLSKTRDLSEADHSKALKSDRTPSVVAEGDEEVSGELMRSSDESAEEATAVAEELFLPGNEFDDLAVEDWWQCEACHKYNYNEMADMCEMCGQTKTEPSVQLRDSVLDLGKNWWRCEECGEYHFDDRGTSCGKCGFGRDGGRAEKIVATDWKKYRHLMVNDCDGSEGHGRTTQTVENLMFCLSCHTDRVYLYNEVG